MTSCSTKIIVKYSYDENKIQFYTDNGQFSSFFKKEKNKKKSIWERQQLRRHYPLDIARLLHTLPTVVLVDYVPIARYDGNLQGP